MYYLAMNINLIYRTIFFWLSFFSLLSKSASELIKKKKEWEKGKLYYWFGFADTVE